MPWPPPHPTLTLRGLILAVAAIAGAMAWSGHWSDCKHQAVLHAVAASEARREASAGGLTDLALARQIRKVEWHEEMRRRLEWAAWSPWPFPPSEPPRPN